MKKHYKKTLLLSILIAFYSNVSSQTLVILRKYKDSIFVGADSRSATFTLQNVGDKMKTDTASNSCKIISEGKFNVAFMGMPHELAVSEAIAACKKGETFGDAIKLFSNSFGNKLKDLLMDIKQKDPSFYEQLKIDFKGAINQTIWFGFQADTSYAYLLIFQFMDHPNLIGSGGFKDTILAGGEGQEILDTLYSQNVWKNGTVNTLNYLIKLQAKRHPIKVSEPIDILMVTKEKRIWVQRKQVCE